MTLNFCSNMFVYLFNTNSQFFVFFFSFWNLLLNSPLLKGVTLLTGKRQENMYRRIITSAKCILSISQYVKNCVSNSISQVFRLFLCCFRNKIPHLHFKTTSTQIESCFHRVCLIKSFYHHHNIERIKQYRKKNNTRQR